MPDASRVWNNTTFLVFLLSSFQLVHVKWDFCKLDQEAWHQHPSQYSHDYLGGTQASTPSTQASSPMTT